MAQAFDGGGTGSGGLDDLGVGRALVGQHQDLEAAALPLGQGLALQSSCQVEPLFLGQSHESSLAQGASPGGGDVQVGERESSVTTSGVVH